MATRRATRLICRSIDTRIHRLQEIAEEPTRKPRSPRYLIKLIGIIAWPISKPRLPALGRVYEFVRRCIHIVLALPECSSAQEWRVDSIRVRVSFPVLEGPLASGTSLAKQR